MDVDNPQSYRLALSHFWRFPEWKTFFPVWSRLFDHFDVVLANFTFSVDFASLALRTEAVIARALYLCICVFMYFCICIFVFFVYLCICIWVNWTVAVVGSERSGRRRCYQECHSGGSNCSFQAPVHLPLDQQCASKGTTGCDINSTDTIGRNLFKHPLHSIGSKITP